MTFSHLQLRLIEYLRAKLRSGEVSERGLARQLGVSQPHLHHVLAGSRVLSPQRADEILLHLGLDLLTLAASPGAPPGEFIPVPFATGAIGPLEAPPAAATGAGQIHLRKQAWDACSLQQPLFLAVGDDPEFDWGAERPTLALLETSSEALLPIQESAWYAVKYNGHWLLRQVRWRPPYLVLQGQIPLLGSLIPPLLAPPDGDVSALLAGMLIWAGPDPRDLVSPYPARTSR